MPPSLTWSTNEAANAVHRPDDRALRRRDDEIVQAVRDGARLTRQIVARLGEPASRHNSYAVSQDVQRLVHQGRLRKVGTLSDHTTAIWEAT